MLSTPLRAALAASALAFMSSAASAQNAINIYTLREPALIKPLLDAFTTETGIKVNIVFAKEGLAERIASEGSRSPADVLLTADVANLERAAELGIAAALTSDVLQKAVPSHYRDPANRWFGLTYRARVVYVSKERVKDTEITYESLADPKWKGRFCIRDGQHTYNNMLFASAIAHLGEARTEEWLRGLKANLSRKPSGGDREVAKDIASGACDIGLANTYYIGHMHKNPDQRAWGDAVRVVMPKFRNGGTHINLSGIAVMKTAPNHAAAVALSEWLVSPKAQAMYSNVNYEFPVLSGVALDPAMAALGSFIPETIGFETILKARARAAELVDRTGFNGGPGS